ncbi:MAG: signal peptidase I [Bacillota bacterium]
MAIRIKGILTLIIFFLVCMGISFYISRYMFVVYPVEGESMVPTISHGDKVLVYRTDKIEHGDIVVFDSEAYEKCLIKRVIGLEGDFIEIKYDEETSSYQVYRNQNLLIEEYIREPMLSSYYDMEVEVPPGKMFFLGDNRNWSLDSHNSEIMEDVSTIQGRVIMRYDGFDISFFALLEA